MKGVAMFAHVTDPPTECGILPVATSRDPWRRMSSRSTVWKFSTATWAVTDSDEVDIALW